MKIALQRLGCLLLILTLSVAYALADVHHSDFETLTAKYEGVKMNNFWGRLVTPDKWEANPARFKTLEAHDITDLIGDSKPTDNAIAIKSSGVLSSPSLQNGIKNLSFHFAHYYSNSGPYKFKVEITDIEGTEVYKTFQFNSEFDKTPTDTLYSEALDIASPCKIVITNTAKESHNDIDAAVCFWNFTWEDAGQGIETPELPKSDDNLLWSQTSGEYVNGTVIMVSGQTGAELKLYNAETEEPIESTASVTEGIPAIAYLLPDNCDLKLKAVSKDIESYHYYTTSVSGASPVLALSLPEGKYGEGTPFIATGVPGKELALTYPNGESETKVYTVPAHGGTPCEVIPLFNVDSNELTITLSSDGENSVVYKYQLNINTGFVPYDADGIFDFRDLDNLYVNGVLVEKPETLDYIKISGQTISPTKDGILWAKFDSANIIYDPNNNQNNRLIVSYGSKFTVGTVYRTGEVVIDFNQIRIIQFDDVNSISPGSYNNNDEDGYVHTWRAASQAPAMYATDEPRNHKVEFTANQQVSIFRIETSHHVITGVGDVEINTPEAEPVYYDLQGRQLNTKPESGIYIERRGCDVRKIIM